MSKSIHMERERWPVLVVRMVGQPTDDEFAAYLDAYEGLMGEHDRYGIVYVTMPNAPMTKSRHARMQAKWIAAHEDEIRRRCVGVGFVLPSPIMRGVLRAILAMQSMPVPYRVFDDEEMAIAWVNELVGPHGAARAP